MRATFTYAIKFVSDMDGAVAFYRDQMGLELRFASPFWTEFETGSVTLALHPASDRNPAGGVQLGFSVGDLDSIYEDRAALGVSFAAAPADEHGTRLARILDFDGAELSLSEARRP